jgi:hypothetical protein
MRAHNIVRLVASSILMLASPAFAAEVAVFPAEVTNLTQAQADAIGAVFAAEYSKVLGKEVLGPAESAAAIKEGAGLAEAAQSLGVAEFVQVKAVALDTKILVTAIRRSKAGAEIYRAEMTAVSLDDLTSVGDRLSRSLLMSKSPAETIAIENVTKAETQSLNRTASQKVMGLKTSVGFPVSDSKLEPYATLGFDGRLEGKNYFIELGAGFMVPAAINDRQGYGGLYADIGADYYLSNGSVSPYIGGGIMPRIIIGSDVGVNVAPYLQAGLMFNREARTRIYVDARVAQNVLPVKISDSSGNSASSYPTELSLQIGIGF